MNNEQLEILQKVADLYLKYGIRSVTMDDISRELGISKKTLYQYVNDKEELVSKVLDMEFDKIIKEIGLIAERGENAIEIAFCISKFLSTTIRQYPGTVIYDLKKYYPKVYEDFISNRRKIMYDNQIKNLKRGISEGLFRDDFNVEIIAKFQVSRLEAQHDDIFADLDNNYSRDEIFTEIFVYHLRGISNKKGIEYLETKLLKSK